MELVKRFAMNTKGRDLAIGDIHGHFEKAMAALLEVGFDPKVDRVFSVGDLVDRGPESMLATDWLGYPWFHAVRGNHEQMVVEQMEPYVHLMNGGAWFVGMSTPEKQPYIDAFSELPLAIEVETERGPVGIVHAECPYADWRVLLKFLDGAQDCPELDHVQAQLQWSRDRFARLESDDIWGVRAVVVGHTPMERYSSLGNTIYIDTGAWLPQDRHPGRKFTILDLATLAPACTPVLDFNGSRA